MKNKKMIIFALSGFELNEIIEEHIKGKLGKDITIEYNEFIKDGKKLSNENILNDDENEFKIYVEYTRG